jgi:hypothetical protein
MRWYRDLLKRADPPRHDLLGQHFPNGCPRNGKAWQRRREQTAKNTTKFAEIRIISIN